MAREYIYFYLSLKNCCYLILIHIILQICHRTEVGQMTCMFAYLLQTGRLGHMRFLFICIDLLYVDWAQTVCPSSAIRLHVCVEGTRKYWNNEKFELKLRMWGKNSKDLLCDQDYYRGQRAHTHISFFTEGNLQVNYLFSCMKSS